MLGPALTWHRHRLTTGSLLEPGLADQGGWVRGDELSVPLSETRSAWNISAELRTCPGCPQVISRGQEGLWRWGGWDRSGWR